MPAINNTGFGLLTIRQKRFSYRERHVVRVCVCVHVLLTFCRRGRGQRKSVPVADKRGPTRRFNGRARLVRRCD